MELQAEYLREQHERRSVVHRIALSLAFCCLITSHYTAFSAASLFISILWNLLFQNLSSRWPQLHSDDAKIAVKSICAQLHVLSGSPFGWTYSLATSLFEYFIYINPYQEDYKNKLIQIQHWSAINTLLTLISMNLSGASYCAIIQALIALETTRFVMTKIYELHGPLIFKLHHTNEEKSAFISVVSHEIRTPLTYIINSLELLEESLEGSEILDGIQKSCGLLLRLINKILTYSKWKGKRSIVDNQIIDIREVFRNLLDQFTFDVNLKGLYLNFSVDEEISQFGYSDKLKVEELFLHLIGNAIKFTEEGGVTVNIKNGEYDFGEDTQHVIVSVIDTGIGMSEEASKTIFQPFSNNKKIYQSLNEGTGLGLSICDEITRCLNGSISVESRIGIGTTLTVSIPFSKAARPLPEDQEEEAILPLPQNFPAVILCEDNILIRKVVKELLHKEGFVEVVTCCDGLELIQAFKEKMTHIVLTDQHMPNMDGGAALKILKENYPTFPFRSILLTADVSFEKPWYVDKILIKPTNGKDLKRVILEEYQGILCQIS